MRFGFEGRFERRKEIQKEAMERAAQRFASAETHIERLEALEKMMELMVEAAESTFALEIAQKYLSKIYLKQDIANLEKGWGDVHNYQKLKGLGIFMVHDREMEHDIEDPDGDIELGAGDRILDLHIPPIPEENRKSLRSQTEESLKLLAQYIKEHKLSPKLITGVTYESIGKLAKRFGFETKEIPIPEEVAKAVQKVYEESGRKSPIGSLMFVYQDPEKFLKQWGE